MSENPEYPIDNEEDVKKEENEEEDEELTDREIEVYKGFTKFLKKMAGPYYPLLYLGASATQSWARVVNSFKKEKTDEMELINDLAKTGEELINQYAKKHNLTPEEAIEIAYKNNLPKEYHGAAKILTKRIMKMPWDDTVEMGVELFKEMPWDDYIESASKKIKRYGLGENEGDYRNTRNVFQDLINKYIVSGLLGFLAEN